MHFLIRDTLIMTITKTNKIWGKVEAFMKQIILEKEKEEKARNCTGSMLKKE